MTNACVQRAGLAQAGGDGAAGQRNEKIKK
jgi:hypothetical protein